MPPRCARWLLALLALWAAPAAGLRAGRLPTGKEALAQQAARRLLVGGVAKLSYGMARFEETLAEKQRDARELILYVQKLSSSLAKGHTFDEADANLGIRIVGLFRQKEFTKALDALLKELELTAKHLPVLTEKRVKELQSFVGHTEEQRSTAASRFMTKERALLSTQLTKVAGSAKAFLSKMPEDSASLAAIAGMLLQQTVNHTLQALSGPLLDPQGQALCGDGAALALAQERAAPLLQHMVTVLPLAKSFAEAKAPDVAPAVGKAAMKLQAVAKAYVNVLEKDTPAMIEKVCAVLAPGGGANATTTPSPAK